VPVEFRTVDDPRPVFDRVEKMRPQAAKNSIKPRRFEGWKRTTPLAESKRPGRIPGDYPDTIVAARARLKISELKAIPGPKPRAQRMFPNGQTVEIVTAERPTLGWKFRQRP